MTRALRAVAAAGAGLAVSLVGCSEPPAVEVAGDPFESARLAMAAELGRGYAVEVVRPFVVATSLDPAGRARVRESIFTAYYNAICDDFLKTRPSSPIRAYLFTSDREYRRWAGKLWGDDPQTPYGYYKTTERALIINIARGGGALVHEMTHALVEADFPEIPAWFNESLGSLYEDSRVKDGRIMGIMNWRYPRLAKAIKTGKVIPLAEIAAQTDREFYSPEDRGLRYAEVRYFAMYMEERGLLRKFYHAFRDGHEDDPTGRKTLEEIFGKPLPEIEKEWLAWAAGLQWPGR